MKTRTDTTIVEDLSHKYRKVNTSQLISILKQYDLNQSELADILCVSPAAISNWMRTGGCVGAMARLVHMTFGGDIVYAEVRREIARLGARRYQRRVEAAEAVVARERADPYGDVVSA